MPLSVVQIDRPQSHQPIWPTGNAKPTCRNTNQTSRDETFSYECNGSVYDNDGFVFNRDAVPVAPLPGDVPCSDLFVISPRRVQANPGVNIVYGVTHDGNLPDHFGTLCPAAEGTTELVFPDSCT